MVFGDGLSIYEKKENWYITHLDELSNFSIHYNFHEISIDNGQLCRTNPYKKIHNFMYFRVCTLKYIEIILLHCYINYYTKYLI